MFLFIFCLFSSFFFSSCNIASMIMQDEMYLSCSVSGLRYNLLIIRFRFLILLLYFCMLMRQRDIITIHKSGHQILESKLTYRTRVHSISTLYKLSYYYKQSSTEMCMDNRMDIRKYRHFANICEEPRGFLYLYVLFSYTSTQSWNNFVYPLSSCTWKK